MTSVPELYPRASKLMFELKQQVKEVEAQRMPASDMLLGLEELRRKVAHLDSLVDREVNKRDDWRARLREMKDACADLEARLYRWRSTHDRAALEEAERQELFGNNSALPSSVFGALDEEGKSLDRSTNVMHSLLDTARESMSELATQREILKSTQRRVLDMLTTLGVSDATIQSIARRNVVDQAIVFGGMIVTSLSLYLLWRWVR